MKETKIDSLNGKVPWYLPCRSEVGGQDLAGAANPFAREEKDTPDGKQQKGDNQNTLTWKKRRLKRAETPNTPPPPNPPPPAPIQTSIAIAKPDKIDTPEPAGRSSRALKQLSRNTTDRSLTRDCLGEGA